MVMHSYIWKEKIILPGIDSTERLIHLQVSDRQGIHLTQFC